MADEFYFTHTACKLRVENCDVGDERELSSE